MNQSEDDLLTALRAARPDQGYQPSPASPEATAMITRILGTHPERSRAPRPIRRRLVLAGIPAVAGVTAVGAAVAMRTGATSPASSVLTVASVRTAMLDAFERSSGDIEATVVTIHGAPAVVRRSWAYPAFPQPGQQVRTRGELVLNGAPEIDSAIVYVEPRPGSGPVKTQELMVNYQSRTWSKLHSTVLLVTILGDGDLSPSAIRKQIADGEFKVAGTGRIAGRQAIKLYWATPGARPGNTILWADAMTFLPLRAIFTNGFPGALPGDPVTINFQILPVTSANLKLLTPPIPAGFTHVPQFEPPPSRIQHPSQHASRTSRHTP